MSIAELYLLFKQNPVVTTDSRNCPHGSIFFALKGEQFNGNMFAKNALEKGCAYAVIDEEEYASSDTRFLLVENVLETLQQLANYHRRAIGTRIIGITGTNGKTTTKELISSVLMKQFKVLYTQGNLNNHIGVPLTLLRLTSEHDVAVIEMGANHIGEIEFLSAIAEPNYGLITNVGKAHLEGFGSFEGVVKTKGELYEYLRRRPENRVFINHANTHLSRIADGLNLIKYGKPDSNKTVEVCGDTLSCDPFLNLYWYCNSKERYEIKTQLIGAYNLENVLAAVTIGLFFGVTPENINQALREYIPQNNRSQLTITARNRLVVDAYNANPTSMRAAIENFNLMDVSPKMAILGDMRELGESSADEHQKIVDILAENNLGEIWLVGSEFAATRHTQRSFINVAEVSKAIEQNPPKDRYILIKGSNGINLSQLIRLL